MRPRTGIWILGAASLALAGLMPGARPSAAPAGTASAGADRARTGAPLVLLDENNVPEPRAAPAAPGRAAPGPHWQIEERVRQAAGDRRASVRDIRVAGYRGQFACGEMRTSGNTAFRRFVWIADAGKLLVEGEAPDYAQLAVLCLARPG